MFDRNSLQLDPRVISKRGFVKDTPIVWCVFATPSLPWEVVQLPCLPMCWCKARSWLVGLQHREDTLSPRAGFTALPQTTVTPASLRWPGSTAHAAYFELDCTYLFIEKVRFIFTLGFVKQESTQATPEIDHLVVNVWLLMVLNTTVHFWYTMQAIAKYIHFWGQFP